MIVQKPPKPCRPFTECWCKERPGHPQCKPALYISDNPLIVIALCIICYYIVKLIFKDK